MAKSPIPPPPTIPAIAENPIKLTKLTVTPLIKLGNASTINTSDKIRCKLAPDEIAASITPLSTSLKAPSESLAKNAIEAIVIGTVAASGPMLDPTTILVNGINNTNNITKGSERIILTKNPAKEFIALF